MWGRRPLSAVPGLYFQCYQTLSMTWISIWVSWSLSLPFCSWGCSRDQLSKPRSALLSEGSNSELEAVVEKHPGTLRVPL